MHACVCARERVGAGGGPWPVPGMFHDVEQAGEGGDRRGAPLPPQQMCCPLEGEPLPGEPGSSVRAGDGGGSGPPSQTGFPLAGASVLYKRWLQVRLPPSGYVTTTPPAAGLVPPRPAPPALPAAALQGLSPGRSGGEGRLLSPACFGL